MKKIIIIFLVFIPALINAQTYITSGSVLTGLPTSGTYFKSLGLTSNGTLYLKDTLAVSGVYAPLATPTFTTSITTPVVIGGTTTTSPLSLYATTGVAASGASVLFKGGTNGGTTFTTMNYQGNWDFGSGTITTTGTVTIPTLSLSTTVSGAGTWTAGAINTASNVSGYLGLFGGGVRAGNNTNIYWNSGPIILGNTNDITLKNSTATAGANVSIGTSAAAASSILDITSTVKGVLLPRMTSTQRDAISSPATGLTLFCTDCTATDASTGVMQTYNGATWKNNW